MAGRRSPFSTFNTLRRREGAVQNVYSEFARRLQARMIKLNIVGQSELSRRCEALLPEARPGQKQNKSFGRDRISHYIRGISMPRPESLAILAKALKCKESDLVPPLAVPTARGVRRPFLEVVPVGGNRVEIHINRTVTVDTAGKIVKVLQAEDRK